jgi:hypothetical protein
MISNYYNNSVEFYFWGYYRERGKFVLLNKIFCVKIILKLIVIILGRWKFPRDGKLSKFSNKIFRQKSSSKIKGCSKGFNKVHLSVNFDCRARQNFIYESSLFVNKCLFPSLEMKKNIMKIPLRILVSLYKFFS